jgi:hypothetical protein
MPIDLTPQQAAYQRMLTGDPIAAIEQARAFLKEGTVVAYYDQILVGALRLAQADAEQGRLDDVRLESIFRTAGLNARVAGATVAIEDHEAASICSATLRMLRKRDSIMPSESFLEGRPQPALSSVS